VSTSCWPNASKEFIESLSFGNSFIRISQRKPIINLIISHYSAIVENILLTTGTWPATQWFFG
jgi:hypothetical protein